MKLEETHLDLPVYEFRDMKFAVAVNEEAAIEAATEYIKTSLWTFNSDFIVNYLTNDYDDRVIKSLNDIQEKCKDGCNDFLLSLIKDIDDFVQRVILYSVGYQGYLGSYDGNTLEYQDFSDEEIQIICVGENVDFENREEFIIIRIE